MGGISWVVFPVGEMPCYKPIGSKKEGILYLSEQLMSIQWTILRHKPGT